ncbi:MAG: FkbM family methyltransferase [Actinomycetota bacterium]
MTRAKQRVKRFAVRHHRQVAPFLPRGYRRYRFRGGHIYLDVRESPHMLRRALGLYEPRKHAALQHFLRPGMTFLDIGANVGDFSLAAAKLMDDHGTIVAVEPGADNAAWLRRSIADNGYSTIHVRQVALGETAGEVDLYLSRHAGLHSLTPHTFQRTVGSVKVPMSTLDEIVAAEGLDRVDVMKIDVEGAEMGVLRGGAELFGRDDPMVVLLDLHPLLVDTAALCEWLTGRGFFLHEPGPPFGPLRASTKDLSEVVAIRGG